MKLRLIFGAACVLAGLATTHAQGVTKESVDRMGVTTATNILAALDGKPNLENVVNRDIYRHR